MSVDQERSIDFVNVDKESDDLWLTISDHLPWDGDEGHHLLLLQNKLNAYLSFIESGELLTKVPDAKGRRIVINIAGKFPLSKNAEAFFRKAKSAVEDAGFRLQFSLTQTI
jgi:Family of unknown function (DUF6572)